MYKAKIDYEKFLLKHNMVWTSKPGGWDDGIFLGNGLLGAIIYGAGHNRHRNRLRFVMNRVDVVARYSYMTLFPRIPIGEFDLEVSENFGRGTQFEVNLYDATLKATMKTNKGEIKLTAYIDSNQPIMHVEIETSGDEEAKLVWYPQEKVEQVLKYEDGIDVRQPIPHTLITDTEEKGVSCSLHHYFDEKKGPEAGGCIVGYKEISDGNKKNYTISIQKDFDLRAKEQMIELINDYAKDHQSYYEQHKEWWHDYYKQSFVSISDTRMEGFYWIQMYKIACATRAEHHIIDNTGPWFKDSSWGGIWWNMNVQMSYSPLYTSNRWQLGESLLRGLNKNYANGNLQINAELAGVTGDVAALPRGSSYELRGRVDTEIGNLPWACHNYWRHYRHTMDEKVLKDLYPLLRSSINYYLAILEQEPDGMYHMPPTLSPEYFGIVTPDTHYDLALLKWGCKTLMKITKLLGVEDELYETWKTVLDQSAPLPVDETGYMIGAQQAFEHSHRHFSHLLAIFPLHLVSIDEDENYKLAFKSLRHWMSKEGGYAGFSYTGAASIAATLGLGDEALLYLTGLLEVICKNTLYREGSPVIESPFAGAESINDMLLQSYDGTIRCFPAIPDTWKDIQFHDLRTEGAFLVSGRHHEGQTEFIRIKSLAGSICRIKTDLINHEFTCYSCESKERKEFIIKENIIEINMELSEEVILINHARHGEEDYTISGAQVDANFINYFPSKRWRLLGIPIKE